MKSAALVRQQIEDSVNERIPAALSPRQRTGPEQTPCGVTAIDGLLHGGLPMGSLTELVGEECSGRTAIALAYVATMTQAGGVCAWIDVSDALQPESAAASGVDLERLLWVRCGTAFEELSSLREVDSRNVEAQPMRSASRPMGCGSPHPRSEGKDMPHAVEAMMRAHEGLRDDEVRNRETRRAKRAIGTPGAPNRPLTHKSEHREEQVNSDRLPPRRGDNLTIVPRFAKSVNGCAEPLPRSIPSIPVGERLLPVAPSDAGKNASGRRPWPLLDKALRVADLLLQGGGFRCIVLDLGSLPPEVVWRIPLATWFRFRAACERTRISLILLTQHPCARSSAELVVRLQSGWMESQNRVMTGIRYQAARERSRSYENKAEVVAFRKPPQSERQPDRALPPGQWRSEAAWVQMK